MMYDQNRNFVYIQPWERSGTNLRILNEYRDKAQKLGGQDSG